MSYFEPSVFNGCNSVTGRASAGQRFRSGIRLRPVAEFAKNFGLCRKNIRSRKSWRLPLLTSLPTFGGKDGQQPFGFMEQKM
jgi:hypothetical protein